MLHNLSRRVDTLVFPTVKMYLVIDAAANDSDLSSNSAARQQPVSTASAQYQPLQ